MSTTAPSPDMSPAADPLPIPHRNPFAPVWIALRALASLQLTVVLFSLSMILVFYGTLAQIDKGIWTVVDEYFRSWFVWIPFQLTLEFGKKFFDLPADAKMAGSFPFPGGWLIGTIMLVNLTAAHLTRFKLTWKRTGIHLIHGGIILLMLGELFTGLFAVESRMVLQIGESCNFIDHSRRVELAVIEQNPDKSNRTITIPQGMLGTGSQVANAELPFDIKVLEYLKNTDLQATSTTGPDDLVRIDGVQYKVVPASEQPGVKSDREDAVAIRVQFLKKGTDVVLSERFLSLWQYDNFTNRVYMHLPVEVSAGGKTYQVQLRNERIHKPYTVELLNFEHKQYTGTEMAKDFASTVRLTDPETGELREVRIWMNHPMRHRGETFYQASTVYSDTGTVLQVVKNDGWLLPYASCVIVTLGLIVHFGINLLKFSTRRAST